MPLNVYIILFLFNKINKKSNIYCSFLYKNTNIMQIRCAIRGTPYRVCGGFAGGIVAQTWVCGGVVGR